MDIQILTAKPEDSEAINQLYYDSWVNSYPNPKTSVTKEDIEDMLKNTLSPENISQNMAWMENMTHDKKVFIAKDGDAIVGFCFAQLGHGKDNNKLKAIYVSPDHQGKGTGTKLWETAAEYLDAAKETDVQVVTYNDAAISFYKKIGFEDRGVRIIDDEDYRLKSGIILPITSLTHPRMLA